MTAAYGDSSGALLFVHGNEYAWRHPAALEGQTLTVKDVFDWKHGLTIRADGEGGEWLIDVALPDEVGVWFAAEVKT